MCVYTHTHATISHIRGRTFPAPPHPDPAATVTRSTVKHLAATARAAAGLSRGRYKLLAARVTATARVVMPNRIPLFRFGAAAWRWVTGSARNQ